MIDFTCNHCGKRISVAGDRAGSMVQCPACQGFTRVPAPSDDPDTAPAAMRTEQRRPLQQPPVESDSIDLHPDTLTSADTDILPGLEEEIDSRPPGPTAEDYASLEFPARPVGHRPTRARPTGLHPLVFIIAAVIVLLIAAWAAWALLRG